MVLEKCLSSASAQLDSNSARQSVSESVRSSLRLITVTVWSGNVVSSPSLVRQPTTSIVDGVRVEVILHRSLSKDFVVLVLVLVVVVLPLLMPNRMKSERPEDVDSLFFVTAATAAVTADIGSLISL